MAVALTGYRPVLLLSIAVPSPTLKVRRRDGT